MVTEVTEQVRMGAGPFWSRTGAAGRSGSPRLEGGTRLRREGLRHGQGRASRLRAPSERRAEARPALGHLQVWALDRFSREETFTKATQTILDLEKLGVQFHALKEPVPVTPEDGKPNLGRLVLLALLPVIAAFGCQRRRERVRLAMNEIKEGRRRTRSGRPPGRSRRVTEAHAAKAERLRAEGLSWALVAQRVGLPNETCRRAVYERRKSREAVTNSQCGKGSDD